MVGLPRKIDPCPIVESIFQIRFSSALPEDAVFGVIYNQIKGEYSNFEQLPIMQVPAAIRAQDPALRYNAHYSTRKDNFILQIGPRSISISNVGEYSGWVEFSKKIFETYKHVDNSGVIQNIEHVGLRYINVFEGVNVFDVSNLKILLQDDLITRKTAISTQMILDKGQCKLNITSDAETRLGGAAGKKVLGSVIDIDVMVNSNDFDLMNDAIEYAHTEEKKMFYNILKEDYIQTFNPEF